MSENIILKYLTAVSNALGENMKDFVVIGGMANYIYHLVKGSDSSLTTFDIDLLTEVNRKRTFNLDEKLEPLGFSTVIGKNQEVKFRNIEWRKSTDVYFEIEILVPLKGKETSGRKVYAAKNVVGQPLRYTDILLKNPKRFKLRNGPKIMIPHPGRYILQKTLSYKKRDSREELHKDIAYIVDVLNLYFIETDDLIGEILNVSKGVPASWIISAMSNFKELFIERDQYDGIRISEKFLPDLTFDQIKIQTGMFIEKLIKCLEKNKN
ncbi:hypothetical protein KAR04_01575 [Candidatus Calescamantes bacterium]|nr:hypothetical protein [Candidatus Calescamantes bacterium]